MPRKKNSAAGTLQLQQFKSAIGYSKRQKLTLEALGFRKLHQIIEHKDTPQVRGMVQKVTHLVKILED